MMDEPGISRRALAAGAAWSTPVLAAALAAPRVAASCVACTTWAASATFAQGANATTVTLAGPGCPVGELTIKVCPANHNGDWTVTLDNGTPIHVVPKGAACVDIPVTSLAPDTTLTITCDKVIHPQNLAVICP